jgi:tetrapyrrole methylase family protein / MazG family protein
MAGMEELRELIRNLRGENGCPWDKKQTLESMARYLTEEALEAVVEIEKGNAEGVCEELGDVMLIVVMLSQIAEERGLFDFEQVTAGINKKIIRRHPHVFGDVKVNSADEVLLNWNKIKEREKRDRLSGETQ